AIRPANGRAAAYSGNDDLPGRCRAGWTYERRLERLGEPAYRVGGRPAAQAWRAGVPLRGGEEVRRRCGRAAGGAHHLLRIPERLPAAAARGGDTVPGAGRSSGPAPAAD